MRLRPAERDNLAGLFVVERYQQSSDPRVSIIRDANEKAYLITKRASLIGWSVDVTDPHENPVAEIKGSKSGSKFEIFELIENRKILQATIRITTVGYEASFITMETPSGVFKSTPLMKSSTGYSINITDGNDNLCFTVELGSSSHQSIIRSTGRLDSFLTSLAGFCILFRVDVPHETVRRRYLAIPASVAMAEDAAFTTFEVQRKRGLRSTYVIKDQLGTEFMSGQKISSAIWLFAFLAVGILMQATEPELGTSVIYEILALLTFGFLITFIYRFFKGNVFNFSSIDDSSKGQIQTNWPRSKWKINISAIGQIPENFSAQFDLSSPFGVGTLHTSMGTFFAKGMQDVYDSNDQHCFAVFTTRYNTQFAIKSRDVLPPPLTCLVAICLIDKFLASVPSD